MEYTISILLLPMLTFLVLGLFGMKLRPNTAGYIGRPPASLWLSQQAWPISLQDFIFQLPG